MSTSDDIETKLAAARTHLILDKPFLGALVLRLPLVETDAKWCRTTGTDARKLYYNPDYIDALNVDQVQFVLAHEALHCALSHFARRQHRNKHRWDLACDYAVNPLLLADGLTPPPGVWVDKSFEGMTAEEIYPCIKENNSDEPMDQHVYDGENNANNDTSEGRDSNSPDPDEPSQDQNDADNGSGNEDQPQEIGTDPGDNPPPPLTPDEQENLQTQWQQRMAGAAQQAMQAGKLGGALARMIDHLLQPQLPWRMLLARYFTAISRDDYSYMRPSRREGTAIFPSLRSGQLKASVVIDTSGSVSDSELTSFLAEVDAIKGQLRAQITLHACDAQLCADGPWTFEPWEELTLPDSFKGGGGTHFEPAFIWHEENNVQPDILIYFTDAEGTFPQQEPCYPVIWLIKGKRKVPWGQRIQLN